MRTAVILFLLLAVPAFAQSTVTVAGRVVADEDNLPIVDVAVALEGGASTTTDASGRFEISNVPPGTYTLIVSRDGFTTVRSTITIASGVSAPIEVRLPLDVSVRENITVVGRTVGDLGLAGSASSATRLNLKPLDIPASVDILNSAVMDARGYQKVSDAVGRMAGVVSGEHPTAPSSFSMRGFTSSQVATLRDGIWLGPSPMVMRPQNTFNLDRIELMRGPSSVINGQGSVAGAINAVTKTAEPTSATSWNTLFSYGSFNTAHAAVGVTGPVADSLWYRVDVSRSSSDGYVSDMNSSSLNVTGSVLWRPVARFRFKLTADYLDDDLAKYFGTPLVPASAAAEPLEILRTTTGETIDGRMRFVNYNVSDGHARADQRLFRADASWDIADGVTINNLAYLFDATRSWKNAEGYVYCTAIVDVCRQTGVVQRYYGYFVIDHDQQLWGDRVSLNVNRAIGGRANSAVLGAEVASLDFERTRGFRRQAPLTPADAVDPFNPSPGVYGPIELRAISPTVIGTFAVFAENSLAVSDRIRIAGGLRYDGLDLDRKNLNPSTRVPESGGFTRAYTWWSWRAGATVTFRPGLVGYGQYSNAKDPVSSNLFLVNANQNFDLTDAVQWEAGLKADLTGGRTQFTAAWFDITRDDVLDRYSLDSVTNIGGIRSKGFEASAAARVSAKARAGGNVAYTDTSFQPSANFQRLAGNRPPNIPKVTANAWASYQDIAGLPIEIGGAARYVGDRFANNTTAITMKAYALADVYAAWTRNRLRVTARIDNVTDAVYAAWADPFYVSQVDPSFLYANQLMVGQPRTLSLQVQVGF
ncbi:MAG TPA: TonB-dependent receptor [Vicinamibacterales bacterium]|nr:TonB-dependent receptor [Vicinamibacterales bacterium]